MSKLLFVLTLFFVSGCSGTWQYFKPCEIDTHVAPGDVTYAASLSVAMPCKGYCGKTMLSPNKDLKEPYSAGILFIDKAGDYQCLPLNEAP